MRPTLELRIIGAIAIVAFIVWVWHFYSVRKDPLTGLSVLLAATAAVSILVVAGVLAGH